MANPELIYRVSAGRGGPSFCVRAATTIGALNRFARILGWADFETFEDQRFNHVDVTVSRLSFKDEVADRMESRLGFFDRATVERLLLGELDQPERSRAPA